MADSDPRHRSLCLATQINGCTLNGCNMAVDEGRARLVDLFSFWKTLNDFVVFMIFTDSKGLRGIPGAGATERCLSTGNGGRTHRPGCHFRSARSPW